jgi:hypothetical protein
MSTQDKDECEACSLWRAAYEQLERRERKDLWTIIVLGLMLLIVSIASSL